MSASNSLQQYIDFYNENKAALESNSPQLLNALRQDALATVKNNRLPDKGDEDYEKTSLNDLFSPNLGININRIDILSNLNKGLCGVTSIKSYRVLVHNDVVVSTPKADTLPDGLMIMSLAEACRLCPEKVASCLMKIAPVDNAAVSLNTLLLQDGVFIYAGKGVRCETPVQIINLSGGEIKMLSTRRLLVCAEDNSELSILICNHATGREKEDLNVTNSVTELSLGSRSRVVFTDMEESSLYSGRLSQLFANQGEGSELEVSSITLINGHTRNNITVNTKGNYTKTVINGLVIGKGETLTDNSTRVFHNHDNGTSEQMFKYVLDQESTGAFEGTITVGENARFNEAHQGNKNILVSENARMFTKPQLLIYNDDVKCSHGATTGQLDAAALFYMQTRGIPKEEAKTLLMQAFMHDVIEKVGIPVLRDRLSHLVERRLVGEDLLCGECKVKNIG